MENLKHEKFILNISTIIPQQHYLSKTKLDHVRNTWDKHSDYGEINVIKYNNKYFSVDGHHRLYHMYQLGIREVNVTMEYADNILFFKLFV